MITVEHELFRHHYSVRVRFEHVDRMNVVHNLRYLLYFEEARVEYLRAMGMEIDQDTFLTRDKFFVVRNSCDYFTPGIFDEVLTVLTRIAFVRNSSIGFEHWCLKADGTPAAKGEHVFVHVNDATNTPDRVPDHLRSLIRQYEGDAVSFIDR